MKGVRHFVLAAALALGSQPVCAQATRGVGITDAAGEPDFRIGRQHLVVIAVNHYERWIPLSNPVPDAREIRDILLARYHFDEVHELYDGEATKANIFRLFVALQKQVRSDDSLLVLYAGHGHLDRRSNTGFWIPVNAGTDVYEQQNWLPHAQLRGLIGNIEARHVLVISDSCFAGDLIYSTRSLPATVDDEYFRQSYSRVSRQVITSGAAETVPDESPFAAQLKSVLRRNDRRCLDALMLYNEVRLGMRSTVPLLGSLAGTGHQEGASFLLFLRQEVAAAQQPRADPPSPQEATVRPGFPEPARPGDPLEGPSPWSRRLSAGISLGWPLPVGAAAQVLSGAAPCLLPRLDYDFSPRWGELAVGLLTGRLHTSTGLDSSQPYEMRSYPLAVAVRASTPRAWRAYLTVETAAGLAVNVVETLESSPEALTVFKPFFSPAFGIGVRLVERLSLSAGARFLVILFDQSALMAVSPEAAIVYRF